MKQKKPKHKVSASKTEIRGFPYHLVHGINFSHNLKTKNPKQKFEVLERKTRLELATTSLEGWSSTN